MGTDYTLAGEQTVITPEIKKISKSLDAHDLEYILNILNWMHKNISRKIPDNIEKNTVFRKRTAQQIIKDKYYSGCTDYALVFISLARAKKIPTKYIEAIRRKWLDEGGNSILGHIFAECLINGKWIKIDPQVGTVSPLLSYNRFEILGVGLDSWDLEIDSFNTLKEKFSVFRQEYLNNRNK